MGKIIRKRLGALLGNVRIIVRILFFLSHHTPFPHTPISNFPHRFLKKIFLLRHIYLFI